MAIVNLTPDSFYDGGKYARAEEVLRDAREKTVQGADILDLGAASSRPGALALDAESEWERLREVLPLLRTELPEVLISVDTYHARVAEKSADAGANIINDISGGDLDAAMHDTIARLNLPYIIMHMDGTPQNMAANPPYTNVVQSVINKLRHKTQALQESGFQKIILDPGFGFGKSLTNNYELLKGLPALCELGYPVLAGLSRKSMINKVAGTSPVTALNGTTVLNTIALLNGASILRVHDVTEAKQAIELTGFYKKA